MEEIQFFNYILAIVSVIVSCIAMWVASQSEKGMDEMKRDIKNLYDRVKDINEKPNTRK